MCALVAGTVVMAVIVSPFVHIAVDTSLVDVLALRLKQDAIYMTHLKYQQLLLVWLLPCTTEVIPMKKRMVSKNNNFMVYY
jgi:hypothetical protein